MKAILWFFAAAALCLAGETRTWIQEDAPAFQKGNLKGIAVESDGRLILAPKLAEIYDAATADLGRGPRFARQSLHRRRPRRETVPYFSRWQSGKDRRI